MSVVVNAHEQLLITVTSVVFSSECSEIGTQFLIISGYGGKETVNWSQWSTYYDGTAK